MKPASTFITGLTALTLTATAASAATVLDLDTGVDSGKGTDDSWSVSEPDVSGSGPAKIVTSPHPAWISGINDAGWISSRDSSGNGQDDLVPGDYVYTLFLTITEPGNYRFEGTVASDNPLTDFKLTWDVNDESNEIDLGSTLGEQTSFNKTVEFGPSVASSVDKNIKLTATVNNEPLDGKSGEAAYNPHGFILDGTATLDEGDAQAIPSPTAGFAGLGLIGLTLLRRRRA